MIQISSNALQVIASLRQRRDRIERVLPMVAPAVVSELRTAFAEVFEAEGIPRWVKLSPFTIRERVRQGFGPGPILQRTGRLKKAYLHGHWEVSRQFITYFIQNPYAIYHEFGRGRVPRRSVIRGILNHKHLKRRILHVLIEKALER